MATEERDAVRQSTSLRGRYNGKGTTATGFPVDCEVFRIGLVNSVGASLWLSRAPYFQQIRVPGVSGDSQIIIALLLQYIRFCLYSCYSVLTFLVDRPKTCRYFEERTKRPAMVQPIICIGQSGDK
jgi:hypothetical protein